MAVVKKANTNLLLWRLSLQLPSPGLLRRLFRAHRLQAEQQGRDRPPQRRGRRGPLRTDPQAALRSPRGGKGSRLSCHPAARRAAARTCSADRRLPGAPRCRRHCRWAAREMEFGGGGGREPSGKMAAGPFGREARGGRSGERSLGKYWIFWPGERR